MRKVCVIAASLVILALIVAAAGRPAEIRHTIAQSNGIESLEKIEIGGVPQSILVRGYDAEKPVLLFVHGGPGLPAFLKVGKTALTMLEKDFVVVYWEQRGAGRSISRAVKPESMTIQVFKNDLVELSRYLRDRFDEDKIYLAAQSFGSTFSALAASEHPELYHAYISNVQIVETSENAMTSLDYAMSHALADGNATAIEQLAAIGQDTSSFCHHDFLTLTKWVGHYEGWNCKKGYGRINRPLELVKDLINTPEYSAVDIAKILYRRYFSIKHLVDDLKKHNLFEQAPIIEVPTYFVVGYYDYMTPASIIEKYYEHVCAPNGKDFIVFDQSAHQPMYEEAEKYYDLVANRILLETYPKDR